MTAICQPPGACSIAPMIALHIAQLGKRVSVANAPFHRHPDRLTCISRNEIRGDLMASIAIGASERGAAERKFYSRMAWLMVALIVVGFAPSFYLRGLVHYPRPNPTMPPHVILHGLAFTAWLVIFVVQTQFVAAGRRDLHMKLGAITFLAPR